MVIKKIVKDKIALLTINREEALNAMNPLILNELKDIFKNCIGDENIRVIILTGSGKKAFIAGADIKIMEKLDSKSAYDFGLIGQELTNIIENSTKPIIALVNGFALGGGCEISLACHIRLASDNAMFGQPEVKLGLIPGWGGTQRLPRIVGKGIATELIITGKIIDSNEAYRIGLVNKILKNTNLIEIFNHLNKCKEITINYDGHLVSSDFLTTTYPTIIDINSCMSMSPNEFKFTIWYDNEWSYSAQIIKLLKHMNSVNKKTFVIKS